MANEKERRAPGKSESAQSGAARPAGAEGRVGRDTNEGRAVGGTLTPAPGEPGWNPDYEEGGMAKPKDVGSVHDMTPPGKEGALRGIEEDHETKRHQREFTKEFGSNPSEPRDKRIPPEGGGTRPRK